MFDFIKDKTKYNSLCVIFVLFLYSLATLPGAFLSTGVVIIVLTILVIVPALWRNFASNFHVFFKSFAILFFLLGYLYFNSVFFPQYAEEINTITISFAAIGSVGMLAGSLPYEECYVVRYGRVLALLNFVTSTLFLGVPSNIFLLSMRFGYAMLPSALWFLFEIVKNRNFWFVPLFLLSTLMLVIWGSRGTLLVLALFLALILLKYKKIVYFFLVFIFALFSDFLLDLALDACLYLADLTESQKLQGLISILSGDLWSTTGGRNNLYEHCWDLFLTEPFGNGVCFWAYDNAMNNLYPHNIILQIASESGIFGLTLFIIAMWKSMKNLFRASRDIFPLYAIFFSISIGRLLVSSNYWERPEFWLAIAVFIINPRLSSLNRR